MTYTSPVAEQRFVLDHVAGFGNGVEASIEPELAVAILEGCAVLAESEWAPLNAVGDKVGAQLSGGSVSMPPGFRQAYSAFVEGGWGALTVPQAFGGQGAPAALGFAVSESLGAANMALGLCPMLTGGAVEALMHHGSSDLQAAYLSKLVTGEWTATMNLTEPQAGSDVGALKTSAQLGPDGIWRIKGTKIFISYGDHDLATNIIHLVLARTPGAPHGTKGISLFLVPKFRLDGSRNDVQCSSIEHKLGIRASPTCVMSFGDEGDCHGWLIGNEHSGMRAMFTMMNNARLNVGLQGVQIAERSTQQALRFARDRIQSQRAGASSADPVAIVEHPDVRRMIIRMQALTQAIRSLCYLGAAEIDRARIGATGAQNRLDLLTPVIKSHCTDVGCEVASLGVQVHGGMGFIEETGAAQHYRDIRIAPIYEGTNGIQSGDLVGRKLSRDDGRSMYALIAEIIGESENAELRGLADEVSSLTELLLSSEFDDRLASGAPYLTMVGVMICGWLMERQGRIAQQLLATDASSAFLAGKTAVTAWYLAHIVPEATGLSSSVRAGAKYLYAPAFEHFLQA